MPTSKRVPRHGWSIGQSADSLFGIHGQVLDGLPYPTLARFAESSGLSVADVATGVEIPASTLARRKQSGRFSPDESERLYRLVMLFEQATELFEGDADAARRWLQQPLPALGYRVPLVLARTTFGARLVEDLIGRLEYGVFT